jgi:L-ascorbate metabolism protein UlaG (beta-lactamase superfamily)
MRLAYYGHSAFSVRSNAGQIILIDPFLDNNPRSPVTSDKVDADFITLTHAHGDHFGDTTKIAKRCNSLVICVSELAGYLHSKGVNTHSMHIGGAHDFSFGRLKFTPAMHGSQTHDGHYAGLAAGIIIWVDDVCIYHAGDTGLFYDMKIIGDMNEVDYMLVPIGDNYTMGIDDAVKAVEFVRPHIAIPIHYNTFPLIKADPSEFADKLRAKDLECRILNPGDVI